jgi:GNAT superfamily N-acetyltransferase
LKRESSKRSHFPLFPLSSFFPSFKITFEWSDWRNGRVWWLQSVYCDPSHRRKGVFKRIYEFVKSEAQRQGARGLRLYADTTNERAHLVYEALGMRTGHYQVFEDMF